MANRELEQVDTLKKQVTLFPTQTLAFMPSEKIEISSTLASAIALYAERFIGYFYAGVLPMVVFSLEASKSTKQVTQSLGGMFAIIACFIIGIGVYTFYFKVVGELFLFPVQHGVHWCLDRFLRKTGTRHSAPVWILRSYGVPRKYLRAAYAKVRHHFFVGHDQIEIQVSHGELHVLYLTFLILIIAYFVLPMYGHEASVLYLVISIITYVAALIGDTRQHALEGAYLRMHEAEIRKYLQSENLDSSGL